MYIQTSKMSPHVAQTSVLKRLKHYFWVLYQFFLLFEELRSFFPVSILLFECKTKATGSVFWWDRADNQSTGDKTWYCSELLLASVFLCVITVCERVSPTERRKARHFSEETGKDPNLSGGRSYDKNTEDWGLGPACRTHGKKSINQPRYLRW